MIHPTLIGQYAHASFGLSISLNSVTLGVHIGFDKKAQTQALLPTYETWSSSRRDMKRQKADTDGELEQSLTCGICQDILFQPVSAVPCLHNFCGFCFTGWMNQCKPMAPDCPNCRAKCILVKKNHTIANLVEVFLKARPSKRRTDKEQTEWEAKNQIGEEVKFSSDYNTEAEERCRFCDPNPYGYQCRRNAEHVSCFHCNTFIPAVPTHPRLGGQSKCTYCTSHCCRYMPQGCSPGAHDVFDKIADLNVRNFPRGAISYSIFEGHIFQEIVHTKQITTSQFYKDGIEKLKNGTWKIEWIEADHTPYKGHNPQNSKPVTVVVDPGRLACVMCAKAIFGEMVFLYMKEVPRAELPARFQNRISCWYGRNCRTALHNALHAERLNHSCDQTRF
ncbi:hypothetical protein SeLEV6574_g07473 [Synchytrium endobioticum]|nr:hypothetical protein SeLEV6574_g07473 [Synchytrium endobioticum]